MAEPHKKIEWQGQMYSMRGLGRLKGVDRNTIARWIREDGLEAAMARTPMSKAEAARSQKIDRPGPIFKVQIGGKRHNCVTYNGEQVFLAERAKEMGLHASTLATRIRRWGVEKGLDTRKMTREEVSAAAHASREQCQAMRYAGHIRSRAISEAGAESVTRVIKIEADPVSAFLAMPAHDEGYRHGSRR